LAHKPDIVICTETWLTPNTPTDAVRIPGYDCHRCDRRSSPGHGGVAIWIRTKFRASTLRFPSRARIEICAVEIPAFKTISIGMYLPPGINAADFEIFRNAFCSSVEDILMIYPHHRLIVAGDFNQYDRSFLSSYFSLSNIVPGPTRLSAHLDQIFVDPSIKDKYSPENVLIGPPIGKSDHRSILALISSKRSHTRKITKHMFYDLRQSHVHAFERIFMSNNFDSFYAERDIDRKCAIFYAFVNDALATVPQHVVYFSEFDVPWMSPYVKHLINERWEAYRARNWPLFNELKRKAKKEILNAKRNYFQKKSKTVKGLWSFINLERGSGRKCSFGSREDLSSCEFLEDLNNYFCSVLNLPSSNSVSSVPEDDGWLPCVQAAQVWKLLSQLQIKAMGSDDIPTALYKKCALILAEPISHLIQMSFEQRKFPMLWKIADIVPVLKSSEDTISNTRPISLLPIPAKIAEKLILQNMRDKLSSLLGKDQYGIRKNSSTTHAIISVHDVMTRHADDPSVGASIFIGFDYSKAFDKIDHLELLQKTRTLNLPSGFSLLISSYLHNRQQRVRVNGKKSSLKQVTSGVPQGSLIGPYLFGLYISSLSPVWTSTTMVKYVDDVSIVANIRKDFVTEDIKRINAEIDNISRWSEVNNLQLNPAKTVGFIYHRGNFGASQSVQSMISSVNFQNSVRFLGVYLDNNLRWNTHTSFIEKKCAQRLYILRRLRSLISDKEFVQIYIALIRSLIEYASPAFVGLSAKNSERLNVIQRRCLKLRRSVVLPDLAARRITLAQNLLGKLKESSTGIKDLLPSLLPSGRPAVPFCRTSLRRDSFFPSMCIRAASAFFD